MEITIGTIISGTHLPKDLIPALHNELIRRGKESEAAKILNAASEHWFTDDEGVVGPTGRDGDTLGRALNMIENSALIEADEDAPWWNESFDNGHGWTNDEENTETISDLFNALNEDLPEGIRFCAHEGDGSDFGYWSCEEDRPFPSLSLASPKHDPLW
jgi:hypothetical protein